jgi:hypothetical protein
LRHQFEQQQNLRQQHCGNQRYERERVGHDHDAPGD